MRGLRLSFALVVVPALAGCPAPAGDAAPPPVTAPSPDAAEPPDGGPSLRVAPPHVEGPSSPAPTVPSPASDAAPPTASPSEAAAPGPALGAPEGPLVGGFETAQPTDADVLEAGRQGVALVNARRAAKVVFVRVVSAEKQIVNGVNYRLGLEVAGAPAMTLVVYRSRKGDYELRSIDGTEL